jgi:uncharacterized RDD family membrane protein YckC
MRGAVFFGEFASGLLLGKMLARPLQVDDTSITLMIWVLLACVPLIRSDRRALHDLVVGTMVSREV